MLKKINKITLFLLLTFTVNFSMVGVFNLSGGEYTGIPATILGLAYMFVPMLVVLLIEKLIHQREIKKPLQISFRLNKWFLVGWLLPLLISFGALGVSLLLPGVSFAPDMSGMVNRFADSMTPEQLEELKATLELSPVHPIWLAVVQGLIAGATINAVAAFGEELGWRGFLLDAFKKMSFLKASVIIGIIWGIWHAPLILNGHNYPQHPQIGVLMMTVWCILLALLFTYITIKSKSVIAASVMHGTINAAAGIAIMVIDGGNDLLVGITGLAGFIALAIVLLGLFIYDFWISKEKVMTGKIEKHLISVE